MLGYKATTAFSGIEIVAIDNMDDRICYRYHSGDKISRRSWSAMHWDWNGEPWFTAYGCREYLRDYMRV